MATGYAHPKCYARGLNDCSTTISLEHYFSQSLLKQVLSENKVEVSGLKWQRGKTKLLPIATVASNVLCKRHNSLLSPLDANIGKLAETIGTFDERQSSLIGMPVVRTSGYSGSQLELWGLKFLLGAGAANGFANNAQIKPECVPILFGEAPMPGGWGIYMSTVPEQVYHTASFTFQTLVRDGFIQGVKMILRGVTFLMIMEDPPDKSDLVYRPSSLNFVSASEHLHLLLSWNGASYGRRITFKKLGRAKLADRDA